MAIPAVTPGVRPARTGEVRRFELPFTAVPGRLVNPGLGLHTVVARSGEHAPYTIDVTLLDASDLRLIRAGVWLAHRVVDGRGEWYLAGDQWAPWIPAERVEQMGEVDLPQALADLVRPFRRGAALGPVMVLSCDREEFALRGKHRELVAVIRDDRVQVRRGGVITASYREVTITGVPGAYTGAQAAWLTETLSGVGATRVHRFPTLTERIGAPATSLSDFPAPRDCLQGDSLERVWSHRLGNRMRELTYADLAVRVHTPGAHGDLLERLANIRAQVRGFVPLLDEVWAGELIGELDAMLGELTGVSRPQPVLDGERYLRLLDRLVSAIRAPALGEHTDDPADVALAQQLKVRLEELAVACEALSPQAPDAAWQAALAAAIGVSDSCRVQVRPGGRVLRIGRRAVRLADRLAACVVATQAYAGLDIGALTSQEAFDAGRRWERLATQQAQARAALLARWQRQLPRLLQDTSTGRGASDKRGAADKELTAPGKQRRGKQR